MVALAVATIAMIAQIVPNTANMASPIHPRIMPAFALDSPVCQPPLAAISFFAVVPKTMARTEQIMGQTNSPTIPNIRAAVALLLLIWAITGYCPGP